MQLFTVKLLEMQKNTMKRHGRQKCLVLHVCTDKENVFGRSCDKIRGLCKVTPVFQGLYPLPHSFSMFCKMQGSQGLSRLGSSLVIDQDT